MKSNLLKLTSVLSAFAFIAVTMFSNPAQAEYVDASDVVVEATSEHATLIADTYEIITPECWVWRCEVEKKSVPADSSAK